jgi:hypothetical protein
MTSETAQTTEDVQPLSNANNAQSNHNSSRTQKSVTSCPHGTTTFYQYLRDPSYANAAQLKADSFLNHQRILYQCNCTLT